MQLVDTSTGVGYSPVEPIFGLPHLGVVGHSPVTCYLTMGKERKTSPNYVFVQILVSRWHCTTIIIFNIL